MVTEAIIWVFSRLAAFLIAMLPAWSPPSWYFEAVHTFAQAVGNIAMLSGWINVQAIAIVVGFIVACSGVALAVKFGRIILSLATGGGGSAA